MEPPPHSPSNRKRNEKLTPTIAVKRKVNKRHPKNKKKRKHRQEKDEGRGINAGSQVDRQVWAGGGIMGLPGATATAQFCLIILIIFYAAYICALALRCSCIAIKMLRPATETAEERGKTGGTTGGSRNVLHWMPEESWSWGNEGCTERMCTVVLASRNWYANTTAAHHEAPPQLARCC